LNYKIVSNNTQQLHCKLLAQKHNFQLQNVQYTMTGRKTVLTKMSLRPTKQTVMILDCEHNIWSECATTITTTYI